MMISCIIGTRAQLIKMAPVMRELEFQNVTYQIILTGQHKDTMDEIFSDFSITKNPIHLEEIGEVSSVFKMMFWFPRMLFKLFRKRKILYSTEANESAWVLVHGDTLSTLMGAIIGKFTPCKVAHVESGLRSFSFFNPFPEELTRVLTFYLADLGFCPGTWAVDNLKKYKIKTVNTHTNTIIDAVDYALKTKKNNVYQNQRYVVVSIHRFENIYSKKNFTRIIEQIYKIAKEYHIKFVLHPATKKRLDRYGLFEKLQTNCRIELLPRMGYLPFINLISDSVFVVSDGGSNQEELAYMNKPTLLMRKATERLDGLEQMVRLNGFRDEVLSEFLQKIDDDISLGKTQNFESPSRIIVNYLNNEMKK